MLGWIVEEQGMVEGKGLMGGVVSDDGTAIAFDLPGKDRGTGSGAGGVLRRTETVSLTEEV